LNWGRKNLASIVLFAIAAAAFGLLFSQSKILRDQSLAQTELVLSAKKQSISIENQLKKQEQLYSAINKSVSISNAIRYPLDSLGIELTLSDTNNIDFAKLAVMIVVKKIDSVNNLTEYSLRKMFASGKTIDDIEPDASFVIFNKKPSKIYHIDKSSYIIEYKNKVFANESFPSKKVLGIPDLENTICLIAVSSDDAPTTIENAKLLLYNRAAPLEGATIKVGKEGTFYMTTIDDYFMGDILSFKELMNP
jgi:hypothetical protein